MRRRDGGGATVVPIGSRRDDDPWGAARVAVLTWDTAEALTTSDRVQTQLRAGARAIGVLRVLLAAREGTQTPA